MRRISPVKVCLSKDEGEARRQDRCVPWKKQKQQKEVKISNIVYGLVYRIVNILIVHKTVNNVNNPGDNESGW